MQSGQRCASPPLIIGLGGEDGVGKNTIASYLFNAYGFYIVSFSNAQKHLISGMFRFPMNHFDDYKKLNTILPQYGRTPRELLDEFDIAIRSLTSGAFIDVVGKYIESLLLLGHSVVIPDLKFFDHLTTLREMAPVARVVLLKVERDVVKPLSDVQHEVLQYLHWNATLRNNNSVRDLQDSVDLILTRFDSLFVQRQVYGESSSSFASPVSCYL